MSYSMLCISYTYAIYYACVYVCLLLSTYHTTGILLGPGDLDIMYVKFLVYNHPVTVSLCLHFLISEENNITYIKGLF